jgi:hypothetical protein
MEALALSIDEQNAEDWNCAPALTTPECGDAQPTSGQDQGDANLTGLSLEDTIRKYIPDDTHAAFSLKQRESSVWFVQDHGSVWPSGSNLEWDLIDPERNFSKGIGQSSALVIHDINLDLCKALCERFEATLHPELLAGHIIRFDEVTSILGNAQVVERDLAIRYPDAKIEVYASGNYMAVQMAGSGDPLTSTAEENAFNLNLTFQASRDKARAHLSNLNFRNFMLKNAPFRQDRFEKNEINQWTRIIVHITCFRLEAEFCKIWHAEASGDGIH